MTWSILAVGAKLEVRERVERQPPSFADAGERAVYLAARSAIVHWVDLQPDESSVSVEASGWGANVTGLTMSRLS